MNDSKRVLIVEDEEGLLEGLAHNFKFEGYEVLTAKNGPEGLKKYDPEAYALLDDFYSGRIEIAKVTPHPRRWYDEEDPDAKPTNSASAKPK